MADERNGENKRIETLKDESAQRIKIIQAEKQAVLQDPKNKNADGTFNADGINAIKNANSAILNENKDLDEKIFKEHEEFRKKRLTAELETAKAVLGFQSQINETLSKSVSTGLAERVTAYGEFVSAQEQLIQKDYAFQKDAKGLADAAIVALDETKQKELIALETATGIKLKDLAIKSQKELGEIIISAAREQESLLSVDNKLKLSEDELALFDSLKHKIKGIESFNVQKSKLERDAAIQQLNDEIVSDKFLLANKQLTADQRYEIEKHLKEKIAALNGLKLDDLTDNAQKQTQITNEILGASSQLFQAYFDFLGNMSAQEEQMLDERQRRLQVDKEKRINDINLLGLTEIERTREIAKVNKEAAFENEQIEKRKRQIAVERAKYEKAAAITSIITSTAQAVVGALAQVTTMGPGAYALAILYAATGALQLAKAISTPLPKYKRGRGHGKEELAITGDGGISEYIVREDGRIIKTPAVDTLTHLMPKDVVYPNKQTLVNNIIRSANMQHLSINRPIPPIVINNESDNENLLVKMEGHLKELSSRPPVILNIEQGIEATEWYKKRVKGYI